jgi:alpha-methylacyl-CoA racemase
LKILEWASRLPGPYAGKILQNLGHQVTRIEDSLFLDPFNSSDLNTHDESFGIWYQNLNQKKKIISLDTKNPTPKDEKFINDLIFDSDALILGIPKPIQERFQIDDFIKNKKLKKSKKPKVIVILDQSTPLHDLNSWAETGGLNSHIQQFESQKKIPKSDMLPSPSLPFGGIQWGNDIALNVLSGYLESEIQKKVIVKKLHLKLSTLEIMETFLRNSKGELMQLKLLQGYFPCYGIYPVIPNKKYVAFAAIEEKYWLKFCQVFQLPLNESDRWSTESKIKKLVLKSLKKFESLGKLEKLIKEVHCLSLITF